MSRPRGLRRWMFRVPVRLCARGWSRPAWWTGPSWIQLSTAGRHTGRTHRVMVDVLAKSDDGTCFVQSAYGGSADWFRNLEHDPRLEVESGDRHYAARAVAVTPERERTVLSRYVRAHPVYSRIVAGWMGYRGGLAAAVLVDWLARSFPMLAIVPEGGDLSDGERR